MKSLVQRWKYGYVKWQEGKKYPVYIFEKDKSHYLRYKRELNPKIRSFLNLVRNFLGWIIEQRRANDEVNAQILQHLGLEPDTDLTSLDAFYKREFRKKKYMYFCSEKSAKNLAEPTRYLFEYMPSKEDSTRKTTAKAAFNKFSKK